MCPHIFELWGLTGVAPWVALLSRDAHWGSIALHCDAYTHVAQGLVYWQWCTHMFLIAVLTGNVLQLFNFFPKWWLYAHNHFLLPVLNSFLTFLCLDSDWTNNPCLPYLPHSPTCSSTIWVKLLRLRNPIWASWLLTIVIQKGRKEGWQTNETAN